MAEEAKEAADVPHTAPSDADARAMARVNAHMASFGPAEMFEVLDALPPALVRAELDWEAFCVHFRRREALPARLWVHTWCMRSAHGETLAEETVAVDDLCDTFVDEARCNSSDDDDAFEDEENEETAHCRARILALQRQRRDILAWPADIADQRAALATSTQAGQGPLQYLWDHHDLLRLVTTLSPQLTAAELRLDECIAPSVRLVDRCDPCVAMVLLRRFGVEGAGVHGHLSPANPKTTLVHLCARVPRGGMFPVLQYILQHGESAQLQTAEDPDALQALCEAATSLEMRCLHDVYMWQAREVAVQLVRRVPSCNPCTTVVLTSPLGEAALRAALERRSAERLRGDVDWDTVLPVFTRGVSNFAWLRRLLGVELRALFAAAPRGACRFWHMLLTNPNGRARAGVADWPAFFRRYLDAVHLTRREFGTTLMHKLTEYTWPALMEHVLQHVPVAQWAPYAHPPHSLVFRLCYHVRHPMYYDMLLRIATWVEPDDEDASALHQNLPPQKSLLDAVLHAFGMKDARVLALVQAMHAKWGVAAMRPSPRSLARARARRYVQTAAWMERTYEAQVLAEE